MASFFAEGLLQRLLPQRAPTIAAAAPGGAVNSSSCGGAYAADADEDVGALLRDAVLFVVPNMCPDGGVRGHLRTNAAGVNLNREWGEDTDAARCPEVAAVKAAIAATGLDMLLDVHGALPHH
jgi:murein tripeptide amidase MpaA